MSTLSVGAGKQNSPPMNLPLYD